MTKEKKLRYIINSSFLLFAGYTMLFLSCEERRKINEAEMEELTVYINSFYEFINNEPKSEDAYGYFFNDDIVFYIQNNTDNSYKFVSNNSSTQSYEFINIMNEFYEKSKKMIKKEIKKADFVKQVYDVSVSNLYVLDYKVVYENLETTETFFIKKVNTEYNIYRYFINYNKNWSHN